MKRATAVLVVVTTVAAAAARADTPYHCACCGEYFGKNPNAPTYWRKTLGFGRLVRDHKYEEVLARFDARFRKNDYGIEEVGWTGEALFALGALKSGIHNPLEPYRYVRDAEPVDPIAEDLAWMHGKYGMKIWDASAIAAYGRPARCLTGELHQADPHDPRLFGRYLSVLIATGRFDDVLHEAAVLPADGLTFVDDVGEYLAELMQEYVGMARYEEGATYLSAIKRVHGLSDATRRHWVERLVRGVREEKFPLDREHRLLAKIHAIR